MSYNGGVSYKGDKALAQQAMPEALKLANMVAAQKSAAGLDRLEKIYDLEGGGTVRIVDYEYIRHMYIDVTGPPIPEEVQEDIEELESSVYAIFPVHNDEWSGEGRPSNRAAALAPSIGEEETTFLTADQLLLQNVHFYRSIFTERFAWSRLSWTGANGMHMYTRLRSTTNRYAMSWGDRGDGKIYHRGNTVTSLTGDDHFIGFGIMTGVVNKLIYARTPSTDYTGEAIPTVAAAGTVTIESIDVTFDPETMDLDTDAGTRRVVGTFSQARTDYGLLEDAGFDKPNYQVSQKSLWYDVPHDPERGYHPHSGSLWFNFSPDGTKAVRCRCLPTVNGAYIDNSSWKEELVFTRDMNDDVQMTRTKTANPDGARYYYEKTIDTQTDNSIICPPSNTFPDEGSCSGSVDRNTTFQLKWSVSATPLVIAYDYDTDNQLVWLDFVATTATAQTDYSSIDTGSSETTYTHVGIPGGIEYWANTIGSGASTITRTETATVVTKLVYHDGAGGTTDIPYFNGTFTDTQSRTSSQTYTIADMTFTSTSGGGSSYEAAYTGEGLATTLGSADDNYVDVYVGAGVCDMDLRFGWIVITDASTQASWSSSNSEMFTDSPTYVGPPSFNNGNAAYTAERTDYLYRVKNNLLITTPLPRVGGQPAIQYELAETSNHVNHPMRPFGWEPNGNMITLLTGCGGRDIYNSSGVYVGVSFPIKSSCWAQGLVRGSGGTLAIDYRVDGTYRGMFAVLATDWAWDRDPSVVDWVDDFVDGGDNNGWGWNVAQLNRFPICQQAVYYYDGAIGRTAGATNSMWPSEEFDLLDPFFREDDSGIGTANLDSISYGIVGSVEYVNVEEAL